MYFSNALMADKHILNSWFYWCNNIINVILLRNITTIYKQPTTVRLK